MMITLRKIIVIIKWSVQPLWFWPLPHDATKCKLASMMLYHCICGLLAMIMTVIWGYSLKNNLNDPLLIVETSLGIFPCVHIIWNIICHQFTYQRLKFITIEIERFCELIKPSEEAIVQREYIDKCIKFYGFVMVSFYVSVLFCCFRPVIMHVPLPIVADYPSAVYHQPLKTLMYVHQCIEAIHVGANLCVSCYMALLLWLASAKFRLLSENLKKITNIYDFAKCITNHQRLLEYVEEVSLAVTPFAMGSVLTTTACLIICGLIFITGAPLPLKFQCVGLTISASSEVFLYAWPAEHLIHVTTNIGQTAFDINWYNKCTDFKKNVQTVILRSQKPVIVVLPCGMSSLSLNYYAKYLSTIFSYFTTLRIMFEEKNM